MPARRHDGFTRHVRQVGTDYEITRHARQQHHRASQETAAHAKESPQQAHQETDTGQQKRRNCYV